MKDQDATKSVSNEETLSGVLMNRAAIEAAIPHRDPFLFLDAVVEADENSLCAIWRTPVDADWVRGHFPGSPVVPGVLVSEHVFQACAVLISRNIKGFSSADGIPVLTKIEQARFRNMVIPGDALTTEVKVDERLGPAWYMSAVVKCGSKTVVKLRCVLSASEALARATGGA
ncbi:MAG: 3-hydroxyacyl-[acyl-carrier-protein] dehydratase [Planctomycetota bacterium]|jgi:3-hydroxyacyl-[acyl-carrier-protein] dehydratase